MTGLDRLLESLISLSHVIDSETFSPDSEIDSLSSDLDFLETWISRPGDLIKEMTRLSRERRRLSRVRDQVSLTGQDLEDLIQSLIFSVSHDFDSFSRLEDLREIKEMTKDLESIRDGLFSFYHDIGDLKIRVSDFRESKKDPESRSICPRLEKTSSHKRPEDWRERPAGHYVQDSEETRISDLNWLDSLVSDDPDPEDLETFGLFDLESIQKEIDSFSESQKTEDQQPEDRDSGLKYDPYYDPSLWSQETEDLEDLESE